MTHLPQHDAAHAGDDEDELRGSEAPLMEHLLELRARLLWSLAAVGVAFLACLAVARHILAFLVQPLQAAGQGKLIYTQIFEAFFTQVKVALFAAIVIAFPVIAMQVWKFIAPGLYRNERRALLPFLIATPVLFLAGAGTAYYFAVPMALKYLLGFQGNLGGVQQIALPAIGNYLGFVMQFILAFGIAFQLPILLMLLERSGIVTLADLVGARRYMIAGAFIVAAIFTPPDVVSQLMLAVPLILLYEVSLLAIRIVRRHRPGDGMTERAG